MTTLPAVGELSLASSLCGLPQSVSTMHQYMAMSIMATLNVATVLPASVSSPPPPPPIGRWEMCSPAVSDPNGSPPEPLLPPVSTSSRVSLPPPPPPAARAAILREEK